MKLSTPIVVESQIFASAVESPLLFSLQDNINSISPQEQVLEPLLTSQM